MLVKDPIYSPQLLKTHRIMLKAIISRPQTRVKKLFQVALGTKSYHYLICAKPIIKEREGLS